MYYEYWGLKKPPFDNVPDPSMYVESHASVENTIAETVFAIEEGNDCIALIVGDVGLGKTLSLRVILDSLDPDKYKMAFITNPDMSFVQLLREIIGQLSGKECQTKRRVELLEIFNKLLFGTADEGKKVLIFIDEANAMSPPNLESLRLLTNMQDDQRNLFTIVLAGQIELARRLEHPKRANLLQRIGTYNRLDKIGSVELVRNYVETRLQLAGGTRLIFTDGALQNLYEYSECGIPRLVNRICKLCLKAGETNQYDTIGGEVVKQVAERFQKLTGPAVQKRRPRKRPAPELAEEPVPNEAGDGEAAPPEEAGGVLLPFEPSFMGQQEEPSEEAVQTFSEMGSEAAQGEGLNLVQESGLTEEEVEEAVPPHEEKQASEAPDLSQESAEMVSEITQEAVIGNFRIKIAIPVYVIRQAGSSTREHLLKLAGSLAAQTLQKYPQLSYSKSVDPVSIWIELRDFILKTLEESA